MIFGKNDIYDLLNAKNIPFTCTEHRPVYSMEEFDVLAVNTLNLMIAAK